MQKLVKFNSNRVIGLFKQNKYRVTVLNNGKLFLKQRTELPEPYNLYIQAINKPISSDLFEKGLYVIEKTEWTSKTFWIVNDLLDSAIDNANIEQVEKILVAAKLIVSEGNKNDLMVLRMYIEALKVFGHQDQNISSIEKIMNGYIDQAFKNKRIDQELYKIISDTQIEQEMDVNKAIKIADSIFNANRINKFMQIGAINLILSKFDIQDFTDERQEKIENYFSRAISGLTLNQLTYFVANNNFNSHTLPYNLCLKIEKNIGIMISEVNWSNCDVLFDALSGFYELRPKFLHLLRSELAENIEKVNPKDSLKIIEFLHSNRVYDKQLLSKLLNTIKQDSTIETTSDQKLTLQHINLLLNNELDADNLTFTQATPENSEKLLSLLATLANPKQTQNSNLATDLTKSLTASFKINNDYLFGRCLLEWVNALLSLEIGERKNFADLNIALGRAVKDSELLDDSQKEWALDNLALIVD